MRRRTLALFASLMALVAVVFIGCGGGSGDLGPAPTKPGSLEPKSTSAPEGPLARATSRSIREIDSSIRKLNSRLERLGDRIARADGETDDTLDQRTADWFDECCDDEQEDISDELSDAADEIVELISIYREAGDEQSLQMVQQLGTHAANINAWVTVLSGLPTSDGANAILEDMSNELAAFAEAVAGLA